MNARLAAQAFLTPIRRPVQQLLESQLGNLLWIHTRAGRVAARLRGKGPHVLLLHGLNSSGGDLASFVQPLVDAGFRVITVDLPAHGLSDGETFSVPLAADMLIEVEGSCGHFAAVIAHSIGAAVAVHAMGQGFNPDRAVLIGAPAHYIRLAQAFANRQRLDADAFAEMLAVLKARGVDVAAISAPSTAAHLKQPALFIHSSDDRIVAIDQALESWAAWEGARFMRVDALGHRRLLQSPSVIDAAVTFVSSKQEAAR